MARFQPGQSGNPQGRPRGVANKSTLEVRAFAQSLLSDPVFQRTLRAQLRSGELAPALVALLFAYAFGRPREILEVREMRPLVIDRVSTRKEMLEALGEDHPDAGDD